MLLPPVSHKDFFRDCPWLNIPLHRQAVIIEESIHPRGRLFGGSSKDGKVSKLAALAAKRRQTQVAKSSGNESSTTTDEYAERLRQLQLASPATSGLKPTTAESENDLVAMQIDEPADSSTTAEVNPDPSDEPMAGDVARLREPPSTIASILARAEEVTPSAMDSMQHNDASAPVFDFSSPSPDDVFRKAQSTAPR